jgi:hypothetical protein
MKQKYLCADGPFVGEFIWLHSDRKTLEFFVGEALGRYAPGADGKQVRWLAAPSSSEGVAAPREVAP